MLRARRADTASVSVLLPTPGQLARVVAGSVNLVSIVERIDRGAVVLDVHGAQLAAGPARLTFNVTFGGVLLAGALAVDEGGTRFWPDAKGLSYAQRRETFRVAIDLPAALEPAGDQPIACKTVNLSIGGALLEVDRPLAADRLTVTIMIADKQTVSLPGTVVRGERHSTRLAVAFANVSRADDRKLSLLVAAAQRLALTAR